MRLFSLVKLGDSFEGRLGGAIGIVIQDAKLRSITGYNDYTILTLYGITYGQDHELTNLLKGATQ